MGTHPVPSGTVPLAESCGGGRCGRGGDALLQPVVLEGLAGPGSNGRQFEAQLAYGFPGANDRLTLTPGLALALAPDSRTYGLLWAVAPYAQQGQSRPWEVALEGERQEYLSSPAEHSLRLSFSTLF